MNGRWRPLLLGVSTSDAYTSTWLLNPKREEECFRHCEVFFMGHWIHKFSFEVPCEIGYYWRESDPISIFASLSTRELFASYPTFVMNFDVTSPRSIRVVEHRSTWNSCCVGVCPMSSGRQRWVSIIVHCLQCRLERVEKMSNCCAHWKRASLRLVRTMDANNSRFLSFLQRSRFAHCCDRWMNFIVEPTRHCMTTSIATSFNS